MKLLLLLAAVPLAYAACPNACSHHGECMEHDSCDCHAGFQGGDCSERVCLYNWAWVTSANGDLNFDGDRYDGTVYSKNIRLPETAPSDNTAGTGGAVLLTQAAPGGTWESWPYYAVAQEGHFYMECSNRGLCDRSTGDCVCFDGYTGTACNRMRCPEDCSDRGLCQTVGDFDSVYKFWDKNMARSCKCDAGWSGPACQTRQCPRGNDVLTKTNELYEVQYVDIYTKCEGTDSPSGTCPDYTTTSEMLGGFARLKYVDHFGETYTTAPFRVVAMGDSDATTSPTTTGTTVAAAAEAALKGLPNNVIHSDVSVTAQFCETTQGARADVGATGALASTEGYRAQTASNANYLTSVQKSDGTILIAGSSGDARAAATSLAEETGLQVAHLANPICIRLKVNFTNMAGNLNLLQVDHSDVTYSKETNAQDNGDNTNANVDSSVTATPAWIASAVFDYTLPSSRSIALATAGIVDREVSSFTRGSDLKFKQLNNDADRLYQTADSASIYHPGSRVRVECQYTLNSVLQYRDLGIYTIASGKDPNNRANADATNYPLPTTVDDDGTGTGAGTHQLTTISLEEVIVANECSSADYDKTIRMTQVSNVISVGAVDPWQLQETTGIRIKLGNALNSIVHGDRGIQYHASMAGAWDTVGAALTTITMGYYILADESANMGTAEATTAAITIDGDGTMENVECGDRGLCQEDGTCKCFGGYTGDACQFQKSISM